MTSMSTTYLETASRRETNPRWRGYVSVIVPVYNEAAHVDELLQAIQEQE